MHHKPSLLRAAAALALLPITNALPAEANINANADAPSPTQPPILLPRAADLLPRADPTAPWVSVDDEGRPAATLFPFMTVDSSGSSFISDGAPHDLTATVYTYTNYGKITTTTGDPPNPTATNTKNNQGAFPRCFNKDGVNAPFCAPTAGSTLYEGSVYYVTWDPDFFNPSDSNNIPSNSSTEISLRLEFFNRTSKGSPDGSWAKLESYSPSRVPSTWGMIALPIKSSLLSSIPHSPFNLSITLMANPKGSADDKTKAATIELNLDRDRLPDPEPTKMPQQRDLLIALPTVFGAVVFIVVGVYMWNRKTRRIQLGNVMSRSRHGYTGRKTRRMFRRDKTVPSAAAAAAGVAPGGQYMGPGAIGLDDRDDNRHQHYQADPIFEYRDHAPPARPRGDSDLGSLAGSPVTGTFPHQQLQQQRTGNAFRDEMRRQDQERSEERYDERYNRF